MERRELHARRRPVGSGDPASAMFQFASRIPPPAATAHDKDAYRGFVELHTLHHVIEEAQPIRAPITGPRIQRGIHPKLDIAETCVAAIAVRPRTEDQPL